MQYRSDIIQISDHTHSHAHLVGVVFELHVLCQNVQHAHHLREDEDSMATSMKPSQQFVQQEQLPTASDEMLKERRREGGRDGERERERRGERGRERREARGEREGDHE